MKFFAAALALIVFAAPVWAQDAGTESPLYDAQGVRALGIGGAAAAWLDDPSAVWWNPATLYFAPVKRLELQHTKNAFDTRTEQFAAAFPTLDFGTWAVAGALQTTSDITLTGSQSPVPLGTENFHRFQLAAGYANQIPYHVKFGAALKVAGYRFSGVERAAWGLDIGLVPYQRGTFTTALAVQNLLRPTFSFATGSEDRWPRRATLGAAIRVAGDRLLLSAQAESAQNHDMRFRAGTEFAPSHSIALRAGFNGKQPAFGLGFSYSRFRIDYAFVAPTDLGSEHRFGISIDFGTPVAVQRERRAARVEAQISTALADARERSKDELVKQAEEAYRKQDWEGAARAYSQLQLLFPDDPTFQNRVKELTDRRDSILTSQIHAASTAAMGQERVTLLQNLFRTQMDSKQWHSALIITDELVKAGVDSAAVDSLRVEANDSLDNAVVRILGRSRLALAAGKAAEAAGWAQTALLYKPENPEATGLLRRAELLNSVQRATATLSDAVAQSDTAAVLSAAQNLLSLQPDNPLGRRYLQQFQPVPPETVVTVEQIKADSVVWSWYTEGFVAFRAGRYQEAIDLWQKVLDKYPTNTDAKKNIEQAKLRLEPNNEGDQR